MLTTNPGICWLCENYRGLMLSFYLRKTCSKLTVCIPEEAPLPEPNLPGALISDFRMQLGKQCLQFGWNKILRAWESELISFSLQLKDLTPGYLPEATQLEHSELWRSGTWPRTVCMMWTHCPYGLEKEGSWNWKMMVVRGSEVTFWLSTSYLGAKRSLKHLLN